MLRGGSTHPPHPPLGAGLRNVGPERMEKGRTTEGRSKETSQEAGQVHGSVCCTTLIGEGCIVGSVLEGGVSVKLTQDS